jgi:hypothetical protein
VGLKGDAMRFTTCVLLALGIAAAAADARPPQEWVTVSGQVVLPPEVPLPGPKLFPNGAADESVVVDAKTRGVKNVVVWLRPDDQNPKSKLAPADFHPDDAKRLPRVEWIAYQPRGVYEPRIVTTRVSDTVGVANLAAVPCNFFCETAQNGNFNVNVPPNQTFKWPGPLVAETAPIVFKSAVAPQAVGCLRIFDHPYYAVTDAEGKFELRDAPVGKYRLVYWHEKVGFKDGKDGRFGFPVEITRDAAALPPVAFDMTK